MTSYNKSSEKSTYSSRYEERRKKRNKWVKDQVGNGASVGLEIGYYFGIALALSFTIAAAAISGGNDDFTQGTFYTVRIFGDLIGAGIGLVLGAAIGLFFGNLKKNAKEIQLEEQDRALEREAARSRSHTQQQVVPIVQPAIGNILPQLMSQGNNPQLPNGQQQFTPSQAGRESDGNRDATKYSHHVDNEAKRRSLRNVTNVEKF
ncbi:MAG: hypothetical protein AAF195_02560 [Pseudomonadota bacterium]